MTLKDHLRARPFTLALSSGYFGFFAHVGFARAVEEAGLRPARFAGASAGAIVAAALAHDTPVAEIENTLRRLGKKDFWDPGIGLGLLKGVKLEAIVRETLLGKRLAHPLAITAFDIISRKSKRFSLSPEHECPVPEDPTVALRRAASNVSPAKLVRASCAVPLMFHPVRIGRRFFWDGGILDKMALHEASEQENIFVHYLPGRDPHSVYERRRDLATITKAKTAGSRSALVIESLPAVSPNTLDRGLSAIDIAYEKTRQALNQAYAPIVELR